MVKALELEAMVKGSELEAGEWAVMADSAPKAAFLAAEVGAALLWSQVDYAA